MFRPRSILRLILIGFVVVIAPLIAAVVTAVVRVDRLAQDSHRAVLEAEIATQQSRALAEQLTEMQRALGQFQVLRDPDFFQIYLDRRTAFLNAIENLSALELTAVGREQLRLLAAEEQAFFEGLSGDGSERHPTGQVQVAEAGSAQRWASLSSKARAVLSESSRLIERQANYTTGTADALQRALLLQAAAVIPATIVLAGVFVVLISRPMRQVSHAIRRLGARELSAPIEVHGPRDVEELGAQLDWLRRRIQELEDQKITFLRHISHELKTPLTTIREGAELLAESLADRAPEEAEISRIMRSNSLHLQKLIEDLLQFGKTQELVTDLKMLDAVDLNVLTRSVIANHALASGSKEIALKERLAEAHVRGDEGKLRVVIDNLLLNAIKYTPRGGTIEVSLKADGAYAVLDVQDSGPGISESERERVFEPFYQGNAEYQSHVRGTGLGLAIARQYVEAHDGYIKVLDSQCGAHLRVGLPVDGPRRA